jgi:hypothetical protein
MDLYIDRPENITQHVLMCLMNETADVVYKFNLSGGFEILPDLVT